MSSWYHTHDTPTPLSNLRRAELLGKAIRSIRGHIFALGVHGTMQADFDTATVLIVSTLN